jgi:hypothetical protein
MLKKFFSQYGYKGLSIVAVFLLVVLTYQNCGGSPGASSPPSVAGDAADSATKPVIGVIGFAAGQGCIANGTMHLGQFWRETGAVFKCTFSWVVQNAANCTYPGSDQGAAGSTPVNGLVTFSLSGTWQADSASALAAYSGQNTVTCTGAGGTSSRVNTAVCSQGSNTCVLSSL